MRIMVNCAVVLALAGCCAGLAGRAFASDGGDGFEKAAATFASPSGEHRPETWFHLIGGNVSKEGMDADLDALKEAGISGIQLFHGQVGGAFAWPGTTNQIPCLSKDWDDLIRYAAEGCRRRGLTFKMQNCPGWSQCGGPWIAPSNAMRMVVYRRTDVEGGKRIKIDLPAKDGMDKDPNRDYHDLFVLAFPTPEGDTPEVFERKPDEETDKDGVLRQVYRFPEPKLFRSMEIASPQSLNHAWAYRVGVTVSVNGGAPVKIPQGCWQDDQTFTIALDGNEPRSEWVVEFRHSHGIGKRPVRFRTGVRMDDWEGKAGWALRGGMAENSAALGRMPAACFVKGDAVLDITDRFSGGTLEWDAPAGRWTVLRVGHVNMCLRNGPAPAEATGWECDKLTPAGVEANFNAYIGRLAKGPLAGGLIAGFIVDSWECHSQTWSRTLEDDFRRMRGYDFRKKLPAVFGWIIDSPDATAAFLRDWRQTLGELIERNYHGRMAELARENGMTAAYETSFGDVLPGDIMAYWKYCETPMCEFWAPRDSHYCGQTDFKPIAPCASAAHVYGKKKVAAEACTRIGLSWNESLKKLKDIMNNAYARGVTHFVFHTYTHNPQVGFLPPGTSFGDGIGTPFLRNQTWWRYMPELTAWTARCETMLEAGKPANDILWYLGEAVDHKPSEISPFAHGYKYDYVNRDALLSRISVKDGIFATPEGVSWKVLWVPVTKWMSPEVKARLDSFAASGGKVVFGSPAEVVAALSLPPDVAIAPDEKGRSIIDWRKDELEEPVQWIHRRGEQADWYFASENLAGGYSGEVTFRATGAAEIWDPTSGERHAADVVRVEGGRTTIRLELASTECVFVVFDRSGKSAARRRGRAVGGTPRALSGWKLSFPAGWGAPESVELDAPKLWTDLPLSDEARHFSGTAAYSATFEAKAGESLLLDLGNVEAAATVYVNGRKVRSLWTLPFRCEIDGTLLKDGENELKVEVTSTWYNRLAYDAGLPEAERKTWAISAPGKGSSLRPAGLSGPVVLEAIARADGFDAVLADPLAWLYADSRVDGVERLDEIDVPSNGVIDVNVLLNGLKPGVPLALSASVANAEWYRMRAVPVKRNTGVRGFLEMKPGDNPHVARRAPFEVFDVLEPLPSRAEATDQDSSAPATVATVQSPAETEALRFRLDCAPKGAKTFTILIRVAQGETVRELPFKVVVHPVALPPVGKDSFKYTNWMDLGSMARSHGLQPWSEEHWKMIEKYVRLAARGRQNMGMMSEVFLHRAGGTVTLDKERFSRLLEMYDRAGFWYLEGSHLADFTDGWGSPAFKTSYTTNVTTTVPGALALSRMARAYMEEIDARGLRDRWYQHVADEPGGENVSEYRITAGIVRRYMPGIRTVDAVEEPSFAGALDVWCPKVDAFERHRAQYDSFRTNFGDRVWCYTCCIPGGKWMNRTMDGELLRPALIPWVSVMYDIDGFLHWGYNRWQRGQNQDPFKEPYPKKWGGSNDGKSLPPGDTHIVYPGTDGPWPSARLEATRAGMEDADLIAMLRRRDKELADSLVRRMARGFSDYETSCRLYREVRRDILRSCADARL